MRLYRIMPLVQHPESPAPNTQATPEEYLRVDFAVSTTPPPFVTPLATYARPASRQQSGLTA